VLTPQLVGTISGLVDPPADTRSNGITPPTPVPIPSEIKHETTNRIPLPSRASRYPPQSLPGGTQGVASGSGGTITEFDTSAYYDFTSDLFDVNNQSSATLDRKHDHSKEVKWLSDPGEGDKMAWLSMKSPLDQKYDYHSEDLKRVPDLGAGDEEMAWLPIGSPLAETKDIGSQRPDKRKRAMTSDTR